MIDVHIAQNESERDLCYKIREEVFVRGQNIPLELDRDGIDSEAEHVILYNDNEAVGCARVRYVDGHMKLERIAVLERKRGLGLGKRLMQFLNDYAQTKDVDEIVMSAQQYLEEFYRGFGFVTQGESYPEAGIPHVKMHKATQKSSHL